MSAGARIREPGDGVTTALIETREVATENGMPVLREIVEINQSEGDPVPVTFSGVPDLTGTWGYSAGDSGTVTLTGSKRVVGIAAVSVEGGTMSINGGDTIPLPANLPLAFTPHGQLVDPEIVFTGTDSFVIEHLV